MSAKNSTSDPESKATKAKLKQVLSQSTNGAVASAIVMPEVKTISQYMEEVRLRGNRIQYWDGRIFAGDTTMIVGRPFDGKSTFAEVLAMHIAKGKRLLLIGKDCRKARVLYAALERNGTRVVERFAKWGVRDDEIFILDNLPLLPVAGVVEYLEEQLTKFEVEVIIIDHLHEFTKVTDSNDYSQVSAAVSPLNQLAKRTNKGIVASG